MTLVYGENATFTVDLNGIARDNNTGDTQRYAIETTLPGTKYTFSMYDRSYNYSYPSYQIDHWQFPTMCQSLGTL